MSSMLQKLGIFNKRNMYWSCYKSKNFGDWIGPYIFKKYTGTDAVFYKPKTKGLSTGYFTVGSILRHIKTPNRAIVWGSGIISCNDFFCNPKNVLAIRGPITQNHLYKLGYDNTDVFGDPAILLPDIYKPNIHKKFKIGLIPHMSDFKYIYDTFSNRSDINIINTCNDVELVINEIIKCEYTVSSSLHGIIISHGYGVPSCWIEPFNKIQGDWSKFLDYYEAAGIRNQTPAKLNYNAKEKDLEAMARNSSMPDLGHLKGPLQEVCPFL